MPDASPGPPPPDGEGRPGPPGPARALDAILAALLTLTILVGYVRVIFLIEESDNTIAYSLPAANLVTHGRLNLPQLGSQYRLDEFWLLNSPLMALGQVPFFATFGTTRHADLGGLSLLAGLNILIFAGIVRRALGLRYLTPAVFLSSPFLLNFIILAELSLQRYLVIGYGLTALAFLPVEDARTGARPAWQWLVAGSLPLVHPGLGPAWAAWLAWEFLRFVAPRVFRAEGGPPRPTVPRAGLAALAVTTGLAVAWYGRPEMLREQFLPHLRYGNFRGGAHFTGLWNAPTSPLFSVPSRAINVAVALTAVGLTAIGVRREGRRRLGPILLPAVLIASLFVLDALRGFAYFALYYLGAGVNLLFAFRGSLARRAAILLLGVLAPMSLVFGLRFASAPIKLYNTPATVAFIVEHTRPGDRIVIGPPFVLAAAPGDLPGDRRVLRVVPSPYFLGDFDEGRFRADIASATDVYLGAEMWYNKQLGYHVPETVRRPIFGDSAAVTRLEFSGLPVVVARRTESPGRSDPAP